jgi:hypothetical protein
MKLKKIFLFSLGVAAVVALLFGIRRKRGVPQVSK